MTVYDFMKKIGKDELFYICVDGKPVTTDGAASLKEIESPDYENENVLVALEYEAVRYDIRLNILYAER